MPFGCLEVLFVFNLKKEGSPVRYAVILYPRDACALLASACKSWQNEDVVLCVDPSVIHCGMQTDGLECNDVVLLACELFFVYVYGWLDTARGLRVECRCGDCRSEPMTDVFFYSLCLYLHYPKMSIQKSPMHYY